jgi:hypothetical protein
MPPAGLPSRIPRAPRGAALKSGGSAQNESKFSVISSRRQPSGRRDGFRLTPLRMCSCGRGPARACLLVVPWSICLGRPAESRQRCQACAQRRGDRDSGRARRGFSRPPSGLKWPRGVSSFMTQHQRAPVNTSPGVSFIPLPSVVQVSTHGT